MNDRNKKYFYYYSIRIFEYLSLELDYLGMSEKLVDGASNRWFF